MIDLTAQCNLPAPRTNAYQQIMAVQRLLLRDLFKKDTTPLVRAHLARAFDVLEERKRIMKMRPKPKDIDIDPVSLAKLLKLSRNKAVQEIGGGPSFEVDAQPARRPFGKRVKERPAEPPADPPATPTPTIPTPTTTAPDVLGPDQDPDAPSPDPDPDQDQDAGQPQGPGPRTQD